MTMKVEDRVGIREQLTGGIDEAINNGHGESRTSGAVDQDRSFPDDNPTVIVGQNGVLYSTSEKTMPVHPWRSRAAFPSSDVRISVLAVFLAAPPAWA